MNTPRTGFTPTAFEDQGLPYLRMEPVDGLSSITATLPDIHTVKGYQEKTGRPPHGYFRMVPSLYHRKLSQHIAHHHQKRHCLLYPNAQSAAYEAGFFARAYATAFPHLKLQHGGLEKDGHKLGFVLFDDETVFSTFFDHTKKRGATLSVYEAAWWMGLDHEIPGMEKHVEDVQKKDLFVHSIAQLSEWEGATHGLLYPSGMAAVCAALEQVIQPGYNEMVVVGHLYSDTHFLLEEAPWPDAEVHTHFLRVGEEDALSELLQDKTRAVFVESITNPLCEVPDLPKIVALARKMEVPVLVDNTMATPFNCSPLEVGASLVIESTTKYLSGRNLHAGGAVFCNETAWFEQLQQNASLRGLEMTAFECGLLWLQMQDFPERMVRFNRNGHALAAFLGEHPAVEQVFFADRFLEKLRHVSAPSGVVSFSLKESSLKRLAAFYDTPMKSILKAPSLGSNRTLLCPYPLLTYYHRDAGYLDHIRLDRYLVRVAAGCEANFDGVLEDLDRALASVSAG